MKIVAFTPYYPPHTGGLEEYAYELHKNLARTGHQITVFTPNIPRQAKFESFKNVTVKPFPAWEIIFNYPLPKIWLPSFWLSFFKLFKNKPDLVVSYTRFFCTSMLAFCLAKTTSTAWVHVEHGSDYVVSNNPFIKYTARLFDVTLGKIVFRSSTINIAPSKSARKFIRLFDAREVPVIYRGLNYEKINSIPTNDEIRRDFPNKTIIAYSGRFIDGKGIPDLIRAVAMLDNKNWTLILIGDGSRYSKIKNMVKSLNLANRSLFLGGLKHPHAISCLKAADIIVNPSYNEGLPTTILEAAACSKAIVATNVGGTPEIIKHDKSGLLYQPGNTKALYQHLTSLISNKKKLDYLSHNAYLSVTEKFNWEKTTTQYSSIFFRIKH